MFGFPKIDNSSSFKYNKNYLRSVSYRIDYSHVNVNEHLEEIKSLFSHKYPMFNNINEVGITIKVPNESNKVQFSDGGTPLLRGVEMKDSESKIIWSIQNDSTSIVIAGGSYLNFEKSCGDFIVEFKQIMKILKVLSFNSVAIRKTNILEFSFNKEQPKDITEVFKFIFNASLNTSLNNYPCIEKTTRYFSNLNYHDDKDLLLINYGIDYNVDLMKGMATLDSNRIIKNVIPFDGNLKEVMKIMNAELFDVFAWFITPEARELLNK